MLTVGTAVNYGASAGVANAALNPGMLDAGSVGVYGIQEGEYVEKLIISGATATGKIQASTFKGKNFKVCEGLGGGKFKTSEYVNRTGIQSVNASVYAAPAPWRGYIGWNTVAGNILITGLKESYNSIDLEIREQFSNREEGQALFITVPINATGETNATVAAKVAAAINADQRGATMFTATVTTDGTDNRGVRLEAVDATKSYSIANRGAIETSPLTYRGVALGSGTYERLRRFEVLSQAKKGNFYTSDREYREVPTSLVDGAQYDVYMLGALNSHVPGGFGGAGLAGNAQVATTVELQFAFVVQASTAGLNQIEFETVLKALSGATFTSIV